ncbi:MAG TPA: hypothetical protein GX706_01125 [Candidatus Moranbacteria bacterium]|nr:hypothetical protein [Candidatus Moranbacteria bacterium]
MIDLEVLWFLFIFHSTTFPFFMLVAKVVFALLSNHGEMLDVKIKFWHLYMAALLGLLYFKGTATTSLVLVTTVVTWANYALLIRAYESLMDSAERGRIL